jgi:lipopolysaccharide/colanic/teichoic acid biosynthesis glycosyltransferase
MLQIQYAIKRFFDIAMCVPLLLIGLPVFGGIALLVRLSSPGPTFFVQERVGLHGKRVRMYKFRTMTGKPPTKHPTVWTREEEARVTWIGRYLRDYGLDELPQIIHILRGEMSIIGPRPPLPVLAERLTEHQRRMFHMKPGVLSLAAIVGRRSIPMDERLQWHVFYVEHWSLWLDLVILWQALVVVLGLQNATESVVAEGDPNNH